MQIRKKTEGTNMITVQTDSRDVCAVMRVYVGVRSNVSRDRRFDLAKLPPKIHLPAFLFSPLAFFPSQRFEFVNEVQPNLSYKRYIIDPPLRLKFSIY